MKEKIILFLGDKDQEERNKAVQEFKSFVKDVLVATDVASKGLGKCILPKKIHWNHISEQKNLNKNFFFHPDFPEIKHVINYDMPDDIENYVHRIGRTGRGNAKGFTFFPWN